MKTPFTLTLPKELRQQILEFRDDLQARITALESRRSKATDVHSERLLEVETLLQEIAGLEAEGASISDESVNKLSKLNAKLPVLKNSLADAAREKAAADNATEPLGAGAIMAAIGTFYTEVLPAALDQALKPFCAFEHNVNSLRQGTSAWTAMPQFANNFPWWANAVATSGVAAQILEILERALSGDPCLFVNSLARCEALGVQPATQKE